MKTLYIMCGLGFSGKSTLSRKIAKDKRAELISEDAIYFEKEKELDSSLTEDEQWESIEKISVERIAEKLKDGKSVVFDDTSLRREHRDLLRSIASENGAGAIVVYLDTPDEVLIERQNRNKEIKERHDVEQKYLDQGKRELEKPAPDENVFVFTPETDFEEWVKNLP